MRNIILLFLLLNGCSSGSNDDSTTDNNVVTGSWKSECLTKEIEISGTVTEYRFNGNAVQQINTYYDDNGCASLTQGIENPIVIEGEYSFSERVTTTSGIEANIYNFIFYSTPPSDNYEAKYGVYIDNDALYLVYGPQAGPYTISFDYPFYNTNT